MSANFISKQMKCENDNTLTHCVINSIEPETTAAVAWMEFVKAMATTTKKNVMGIFLDTKEPFDTAENKLSLRNTQTYGTALGCE